MKAKYGDTIIVHFTCALDDGTIVDSSDGRAPLELKIGKSGFIRGFERGFIGMEPGEKKSIVVAAEEAYGPYREELRHVISRDHFPEDIPLEVGAQIKIKHEHDEKVIRVVDVDESTVTLDANHYLAGKDLHFELELVDILKPGPSPLAYFSLGSALEREGFREEARDHYRDAVEADPDFIDAWFRLGVLEQVMGLTDDAARRYRHVLELKNDHVEAMINLGNILRLRGEYDEAISLLERAATVKPDHASTYNTLGAVYKDRDDLDTAIAHYRKALELDPHFAEALNNLGVALQEKAQFQEAEKVFRQAVASDPNLAEAHFNLASVLLLSGNFREGWEEYEWRLKLTDSRSPILAKPWTGEDIAGKSILLLAEQGFGDTIQFIRYAPRLAERGATVSVACQRELVTLFERVQGISQVVDIAGPLPACDVECYLLSIPRLMRTNLDEVPSDVPYFSADPEAVERWRQIIGKKDAYRVGLAWSGDPAYRKDRVRSLRMEQLAPLLKVPGAAFYKLQKDAGSGESPHQVMESAVFDYTPMIQDFADTAACIETLDLVISVDTSIAHLAGALGKPVWTLLPYIPDWRWLLNRDDSPWYPTMRLFRQPSPGDWEAVISNVAKELEKLISMKLA